MLKTITTIIMISGIIFTVSLISSTASGSEIINNPTKNIRGHTPQYILINGKVTLPNLLKNDAHSEHLRRRLSPIPASKAIEVPCHNATSNCGMHGECRISGENKFCHCDSGYSSFTKENPCAEKGEAQLVLAIMQYIFGYTGGPAFALGWTALGVSILVMCCLGCCCTVAAQGDEMSDSKRVGAGCIGILCLLATAGLWIYIAVKISTECVDKDGTPCKGW